MKKQKYRKMNNLWFCMDKIERDQYLYNKFSVYYQSIYQFVNFFLFTIIPLIDKSNSKGINKYYS